MPFTVDSLRLETAAFVPSRNWLAQRSRLASTGPPSPAGKTLNTSSAAGEFTPSAGTAYWSARNCMLGAVQTHVTGFGMVSPPTSIVVWSPSGPLTG